MYKGYHRATTLKKILLHVCCGVCTSAVVQKLRDDGFEVTGFFYNPNIYPENEYEQRLEVVRQASQLLGFTLVEGLYEKNAWQDCVQGLEAEPEGGKRCQACFRMRLRKTAEKAQEVGIEHLASTLSVSPHKNAQEINTIGQELSKGFLPYDFKKQDGFKKTMAFAKEHNFYRQHYCGCVYSKKSA